MGKNLLKFLLPLSIFITPLIPIGFGLGYEAAKVLVFLSLNIVCGLIFIYLLHLGKLKIHWTKIKIAGIGFLIALGLTSVFGLSPMDSLMGKQPYYQGLILYGILFLFFLMISEVLVDIRNLAKSIALSAFIVSLISIFQFILINLLNFEMPTYGGRVVSTFGQPNFYSGFLLLSLPFIYYLIYRSKNLSLYIFCLIVCVLAIFLSQSRTAILLMVLYAGFVVFKFLPKISGRLLFIVLICGIWSLYAFSNIEIFYKEVVEPRSSLWLQSNSPEKRILIWPVITDLIILKPFNGYGLENLGLAYSKYLTSFDPTATPLQPEIFALKNLIVDRSHSYFLDLLVFSGIFGFLTFLIVVLLLLIKGQKSVTLKTSLVIYLVWVQFQNQSVVHLMYFWLIAGLIDNVRNLSDDET